MLATPTTPEPKSMMLPGSGVPSLNDVPVMSNDSEGIGSMVVASDGQPGEWQPMPLFSSQ